MRYIGTYVYYGEFVVNLLTVELEIVDAPVEERRMGEADGGLSHGEATVGGGGPEVELEGHSLVHDLAQHQLWQAAAATL